MCVCVQIEAMSKFNSSMANQSMRYFGFLAPKCVSSVSHSLSLPICGSRCAVVHTSAPRNLPMHTLINNYTKMLQREPKTTTTTATVTATTIGNLEL